MLPSQYSFMSPSYMVHSVPAKSCRNEPWYIGLDSANPWRALR